MDKDFTILLIGAGNMGGALLGGWLAHGFDGAKIAVADPAAPQPMLETISRAGARHVSSAAEVAAPDVMVLAVKPQIMDQVLEAAAQAAGDNTVAVSVAAGTTIARIEAALGGGAVVRAMPNTPALVRRGMTVCCANARVDARQRSRIDALLGAVGSVEWVADEALLDAVTAVSGSGPAYAFYLAECMAAAGVECGLPEALALRLARETVAGAGALMMESPEEPAILRRKVTSPNGTTAAALAVLMGEGGMAPLLNEAIAAACRRSRELSEGQ